MAYCFMDWETRSALDLTIVGGARYAKHPSTLPLLLSWAIDDGPVKLWVPDLSAELPAKVWKFVKGYVDAVGTFPPELHAFAKSAGSYWVAWNMAFDAKIAQHCATPRFGFPDMPTTKTLDAMAQAAASNLPGRLDMAGRVLGLGSKTVGGKGVMKKFADAAIPMPDKVDDWKTYLDYSRQDTVLMRDIWRVTRPLDGSEWQEYWVSEAINDRGLLADLDVCRGALKYRSEDEAYNRDEIKRLSHNEVPAVTMTSRINKWIYPRLSHELQEFVVKERNEAGEPVKYTLSKDVIGRLLEEIGLSDTPPEDEVVEVLELLQFGRSSSAVKFEKILNQADDGRLKGSYVFNGAGQTGRYSSRGVQVHNLPRKSMNTKANPKLELDLLDMIAAQEPIEKLRKYGPVSSTLSKLIRPTFHAPKGRTLVWGDWAAIEARVAPWLANSHSARKAVLEPFETGADLYILNAEAIFGIPSDIIMERYRNGDKEAGEMRQSGKVACIAEGQLVLTDTGLVPIEDVTLDMLVWDGQSFVSHQGSVFKGYKDVWEYQGLVATADHIVWTTEGTCKFGDAAASGLDLVQSGAGRHPLWVGDDHITRAPVRVPQLGGVLRERRVQRLRSEELGVSGQFATRRIEWVPSLLAPSTRTKMVGPQVIGRQRQVSEPEAPGVRELWWARCRVPVRVGAGCGVMGSGEPWSASRSGDRPDRRERALRAGEHPVGYGTSAAGQQTVVEDRGELGLCERRVAVRGDHSPQAAVSGVDARRDHSAGAYRRGRDQKELAQYRGKVAVYDIVNAGPDHRFTVSGKLVHNCLALGFLGGAGALKAMARGYGMKLSNEDAQKIVDGWRARNTWARTFGDQCEGAAFSALNNPTVPFDAGLLQYVFVPNLLRGTLLCRLPDGRYISYPMAKIEEIEKFDKPTMAITYLNGAGRRSLWTGLQIENCLAGDTRVVTRNGIKRLDTVQTTDLVWDGIEWVQHNGLMAKGEQPVINLWGVHLTPDHKVMTDGGWKEAKDCQGSDRADVRLPDDVEAVRSVGWPRQESLMGGALRMRRGTGRTNRRLSEQPETFPDVVRVHDQGTTGSVQTHPRHVGAQGVRCVALNGGSLHLAVASRMEELRRAGHIGLRAVADFVRGVLGGHGSELLAGAYARQGAQQRRVLPAELPLGGPENAGTQHAIQPDDRHTSRSHAGGRGFGAEWDRGDDTAVPTAGRVVGGPTVSTAISIQSARVYDLMDCGPRNRFTVLDEDGRPFIVHNCTQATAASLLRQTLVRIESTVSDAIIVGHTHDEVICETEEANAEAFAPRLKSIMVEGFDWSKGLPLGAEVATSWYYHK